MIQGKVGNNELPMSDVTIGHTLVSLWTVHSTDLEAGGGFRLEKVV